MGHEAMNSRTRAERAMSGRLPDRVPVVPLIDTWYAAACYGVTVSECFLDPAVHARALVSTLERHPGIDGFSINLGLTRDVIRQIEETPSDYFIRTKDGALWCLPKNDIGTPTEREVENFDDERLYTVDVLRPHIVETLRHIPPDVRRAYDISAGLTGPFSQVLFTMGIERVMMAMIDEPETLKRAIAVRVPFALRWAEELAELDPASVWIGEGFASTSLISPQQYREFVLPYEQPVTQRLRELGVPSVIHICGDTNRALEHIAASGADCFEIDWQVDLVEAKRRIGQQISLKGNLHTTNLVEHSPDQIYAEAQEAIVKAKPDGRFVLSSGCALGRDTPPENVEAMVRAAQDWGWY